MANVNNDQRIRNMQSQYGNKTVKIGTGKDAQKINTSVFSNGVSITSDIEAFLTRFDSNKDGKIDEKEAVVLQKVLVDYAGKDKALSKEEFAQMVGQDVNSPQCEKMYKAFQVLVERQTKGSTQTVETLPNGTKVTSNFNADGSGTKITESKDKDGTPFKLTETFAKGGAKVQGVKVTSTGTTTSEYVNNTDGKPIKITSTVVDKGGKLQKTEVSERTYDDKGNMLTNKTVTAGPDKKPIKTSMVTNTYNDEGQKVSSNTVIQDCKKGTKVTKDAIYNLETGKIDTEKAVAQKVINGKLETVGTSESQWAYDADGKLTKWETNGTDDKGKPFNTVDTFDKDGNTISREKSYYKGDNLYKDSYNGQNIQNRMKGQIPTERIIYEADGVTVKEKIVNKFDDKGVIIAQEKYDKDGKLIETKDFSKVDGNIDTAYQGSRGDCYLLAAINGLAQSEDGQKLLQQNVKQNQDGSFEITLPGAEAVRNDILSGKLGKNFPADAVPIQGKITITKEELDAAMLKSGASYSSGDKDVLLLELAYEKYRNAVAEFASSNNLKAVDCKEIPVLSSSLSSIEHNMGGAGDNLSGGQTAEATYILTGKSSTTVRRKSDEVPTCYISQPDMQMSIPSSEKDGAPPMSGEKFDAMIASLIEDSADGKIDNFSATVGLNISQQEVNGEILQGGGHAFSVKSMTADQVVLANPWDPEKDIVMSMDDFKKAVKSFTMTPLNEDARITPDKPGGADEPGKPGGSNGTDQPTMTYEVKRGDNLWKIAKRQLGAGAKNSQIADLVQKIIQANPQIKNPNLIYVGDKINIPS